MIITLGGHQIPDQAFARDTHGTAVELVEQQQVLGTAAALPLHLGIVGLAELVFRDQEEVEIDPALFGPLGELLAFQLQQIEPLLRQAGHVADPDIEIGVTALADGGCAAHGVEPLNGPIMGGKTALAVGVATEVIDKGLLFGGGAEAPDAMRDITGDITGQQGMIEVQHDRQQLEYLLPIATHEA